MPTRSISRKRSAPGRSPRPWSWRPSRSAPAPCSSAARELGAGYQWKKLAEASADFAPLEAAALWRKDIEKHLTHPDSKLYADIAKQLTTMRDLYHRAGAEADFATYVSELRETYRRRPALMSALDRQGL